MNHPSDMRRQLMEVAKARVQERGYNALSFRDLAKDVGIKSASVHYHFPTKGDLGTALARAYTDDAEAFFTELLESDADIAALFATYVGIFRAALSNDNRMCLYGIMAAEYYDLPQEVRVEVDRFTEVNLTWLTKILPHHMPAADPDAIADRALAIFSAIEGAQLVARGRGDISAFDQAIKGYRAIGLLP